MRSQLRLDDLRQREKQPTRILNVRVPVQIISAISAIAEKLGASKTETIVALLNEGLARGAAAHQLSKAPHRGRKAA